MDNFSAQPKYHLEDTFDPDRAHPDDTHSVLMRLIPLNSRVLELGCATGYLSGYMESALGCRVVGLEVDPQAAALASKRCKHVYTADLDDPGALDLARPHAPYDVLFAAAVLEHLKYPERLLKQAHELLQPGALIIVSLPNIAHWQYRLKLLLGRFDYADYGVMDRTHLHLYTVKTGRALLQGQGYRVERLEIAGSGPQNTLNKIARTTRRSLPAPVLPGLFGYELIFVARA